VADPAVETPSAETTEPETDAALDAALEDQAIEIPDGDKLVPLSAVIALRGRMKEIRGKLDSATTQASKASALEAQLQTLKQQVAELEPYAQAYQVLQQTAKPDPVEEDTTEYQEIARDFDLYTPEGQLDIARAKRVAARERRTAEAVAKAQVAPMQQQAVSSASQAMLGRALVTKGPSGMSPNPDILRTVWARLDPALTSTQEGALQAWNVAMGYTAATQAPTTAKPAVVVPDPLFTEKAGGRSTPTTVSLSESDRRAAKEVGLSDAEYLAEAAKMPWRR
jgi:uncharacterized protein (DUF3084 family)